MTRSKILILAFMIATLTGHVSSAQMTQDSYALVPLPASVIPGTGVFVLSAKTLMVVNNPEAEADADLFNTYLYDHYGFRLKTVVSQHEKEQAVNVMKNKKENSLKPDAYTLQVEASKISLHGGINAGAFYGLQTLIQLLPAGKVTDLQIPSVKIADEPRYEWRGMHLDVCRHFFSKEFVKKYIDLLAMYKMNRFHWHLTDDQGWRIEIKKYPKLQQISAFRNGTLIGHYGEIPPRYDTLRYGGYYTQDEVKEIVRYAEQRHITIVPEIEMPGHALAALAAYPELSCTGGPFETGKTWGVFEDVYCPKEETFEFLQNVFSEICDLFPGPYIHIGGDECPKVRWKSCAHCQALMKKEGLKSESEMQSYFIRRIGTFLHSKGKKLIGWDEILEGGLVSDATVMSWRGNAGGIEAAKQNHDVVMTPTGFCYFDFYQSRDPREPLAIGGYLPIEKVYQFEPTPDVLTLEEARHILGAQGNVWTEYIPTPEQVEYMALPRMAALAEVVWSPKTSRNYDSFTRRLIFHFKLLSFLKLNFSKAIFDIDYFVYPNSGAEGVAVELKSTLKNGAIHYTIDGTEPTLRSPLYSERIPIGQSAGIKAALYDGPIQRGGIFARLFRLNVATGKEVLLANPPDEEYCRGGGFSLVNGVTGSLPWNGSDWLGFKGTNLDATIDLADVRSFTTVSIDALRDENSWIYFPKSVEVKVSDDGKNYRSLKKINADEIDRDKRVISLSVGQVSARYVRIIAENTGIIPAGQAGEGNPAWLFVDEIMVE